MASQSGETQTDRRNPVISLGTGIVGVRVFILFYDIMNAPRSDGCRFKLKFNLEHGTLTFQGRVKRFRTASKDDEECFQHACGSACEDCIRAVGECPLCTEREREIFP